MTRRPLAPRDWSVQPPALTPDYKTSLARSPRHPLLKISQGAADLSGPTFGHGDVADIDRDLTANFAQDSPPIGEPVLVHGRVMDEAGRPVAGTLVEIWQANAGGRYRHVNDGFTAPLDPNFGGCGRTLTDATGAFSFRTIKPGAYPWPNSDNSWRPAHIHFSVFGTAFAQRLITQMYFEGDPLIDLCPIVATVPDEAARARLIAPLDMEMARPFDCLAYRFDIVLRGPKASRFENHV